MSGKDPVDRGGAAAPGDVGPDPIERMAAVVLAVDGVAELDGGRFGEVASYLPGRRVSGVRIRDDGTAEVHVVLEWGAVALDVADAVRRAALPTAVRPVDVVIADVAARGDDPQTSGEDRT
ncbi:Asp23/Gls24 family envelope stress response protein [Phytoactinopolyspora endophytica]|uniref:Asp23/Gls24 family envelope stress response protein n=1 Tax=Phytoactinopolyspora endophytica TaxID=1642495 RepID=UPI00101D52A4|nr:Asp23/Gls24 family envelope stress response protein [Phytoactinopolyspora endophytica]